MATSGTAIAYEAINETNGHRYVGVTVKGLDSRRRRHFSDARCGSRLRFHNAIRSHGEEAFCWSVLGDFGDDRELAMAYEAEEIAKSRPEYNIAAGGKGGWQGRKHDAEAKAKMRAAKLGKPGPWRGKSRPEVAGWLGVANQKKVQCVNDGLIYDSAVDAARAYCLKSGAVSAVASGVRRQKSVGGFKFIYVGG